MNLDKVSVSILPRWLGICIKRHTFHNLSLHRFEDWIWKNKPNTQPKSPLQEKISFQRAIGIIHHYRLRTVEEHQKVRRAFRMEFYPKAQRKMFNLGIHRNFETFQSRNCSLIASPCLQIKRAIAQKHRGCENLFWAKSEMLYKTSSKSAWHELWRNLENLKEIFKIECIQATPDAVSESGQ